MSNPRGFKQRLAAVSRLWEEKDYDTAFAEVESMLKTWPGNAHLHVLWASLVQLQDDPKHDLEEAKRALQQAVELEKGSAAAAIELGYFVENVEDNPRAASRVYAEAVAAARHLLIDALIGQARVFRQVGKRDAFLRCLLEILQLARFETGGKKTKAKPSGADIILESPTGQFQVIQLNGPYAEQIQDLLSELGTKRSA
jgi:tetratricopeptide (TPR) repeat protein